VSWVRSVGTLTALAVNFAQVLENLGKVAVSWLKILAANPNPNSNPNPTILSHETATLPIT